MHTDAAARTGNDFLDKTCSAPVGRTVRMRDIVLDHAPRDRPIRVLDVGCGTGALLFGLADALPAASFTGIDVSPANIAAAERQRLRRDDRDRLRFIRIDYLQYVGQAFDLIVTDGVLHLIPGDTDALYRKLSEDLRADGILVCSMAYSCAYNHLFAGARRIFARLRSGPLDALILALGRLLHGREMNDEGLRERVFYMYLAPLRLDNRALLESLGPSVGLHLVTQRPMPSTSLSQLKHRVTVFRKSTEAAPQAE